MIEQYGGGGLPDHHLDVGSVTLMTGKRHPHDWSVTSIPWPVIKRPASVSTQHIWKPNLVDTFSALLPLVEKPPNRTGESP